MVPPNTVVIALAGQGKTRGTVAITRIPLCTNQSLCAIVTNETVMSEFLLHYLRSKYQQLRDISSGDGTCGGLNLKIVRVSDNFTLLPAELKARRKQVTFYKERQRRAFKCN